MIRINLLSKERASRRPAVSRTVLALIAGSVAVLMIGFYLIHAAANANIANQIADTNKQIEVLRPQVVQVEVLKRRMETARKKADLLKSLEASRLPWDKVLEEFRAIVPKDVWVTNMAAADDGALTFDGYGMSYEAVARFMVNLESSKVFNGVDLAVAQKQQIASAEAVSFQLTGRLRQDRKEAGSR
jgi:Tfp pilus assembly protein PilN